MSVSEPGTEQMRLVPICRMMDIRAHMRVTVSEGDQSTWQRGVSRGWQGRDHFLEELEFLEVRIGRKSPCHMGQSYLGQQQGNE